MAWSDRDWVLDGAAVNVSMIGFDDGSEPTKVLDGVSVQKINSDLTAFIDLTAVPRLRENFFICFMGPSAKAPFDIDSSIAKQMVDAPLNANGRPNSDVVRILANAADLVQRSRQKWTIDFGLRSLEEAEQYELPFKYVKDNILPIRLQSRRADFGGRWWQYARPRPEMRKAVDGKHRYIATPAVAKHRIFVWRPAEVLCNQRNLVFARDDDLFFGLLQSKPHELWALHTGSTLEDRPCYTPTTCFETYPFPWPPGKEDQADPKVQVIAEAARELVRLRDEWLNPLDNGPLSGVNLKDRTLTNLYNRRPDWLDLAHKRLDAAVFDAYGWSHDLSDDEILVRLLALNLERAAGQGAVPVTPEVDADED